MARRILWASLGLAPVAIILRFLSDISDVPLFVLGAAALIPLAWLIGEATEHAAHHTGPGIGGFLNPTVGNAAELVIALLAGAGRPPEGAGGSRSRAGVGERLPGVGFSVLFGCPGENDRLFTLRPLRPGPL